MMEMEFAENREWKMIIDNKKLISYYEKCGFNFIGLSTKKTKELPEHYNNTTVSFFELKL